LPIWVAGLSMKFMRQARHFMTLNPLFFKDTQTIHEVADAFVKHHLTSAPVVDPFGALCGMISETGLIRIFAVDRMLFGNQRSLKAREKMLDVADEVLMSDSADIVVKKVLQAKLHRVVVVDNSRRVQGIISPKDILRFLQGEQTQASLDNRAELDRMEASAAANDALAYYRQIYQNAPYMIHSVDPSGKIVACNDKMHQVLEYTNGALVGRPMEDLYADIFHEDIRDSLKVLMKDCASLQVMSEMKTSTGKLLPVEVQSSVLKDPRGNPSGTISITRLLDESFNEMLTKEIGVLLGEIDT
jgi:PAS domain S-box-containing protein